MSACFVPGIVLSTKDEDAKVSNRNVIVGMEPNSKSKMTNSECYEKNQMGDITQWLGGYFILRGWKKLLWEDGIWARI